MLKILRLTLEKKKERNKTRKQNGVNASNQHIKTVGVAMFVTPMFLIKYLMLSKKVIAPLFAFFFNFFLNNDAYCAF